MKGMVRKLSENLNKEDTMKTTFLIAAVAFLTFSGGVMAMSPTRSMQSPGAENGYITIGRSVVVLPVPIQKGDRLELYNMNGVLIMSRTVGNGYLSQNISTIPEGMYGLVVHRGRSIIAAENVPIAGKKAMH